MDAWLRRTGISALLLGFAGIGGPSWYPKPSIQAGIPTSGPASDPKFAG